MVQLEHIFLNHKVLDFQSNECQTHIGYKKEELEPALPPKSRLQVFLLKRKIEEWKHISQEDPYHTVTPVLWKHGQ